MKFVLLCSILGYLFGNAHLAYLDVNSFFNVTGNLTRISWAHAVNNQSLLRETLNSTVMMLEADVVIGNLTGTNQTQIPIMAHPPTNTSDLSLEKFLSEVHAFNTQNNSQIVRKGVKLDFKTIEAIEASISTIQNLYSQMHYPVWLNADILSGPKDAQTVPVDPARFFNATKTFANSTLSIGWTTNYGPNITTSYTNSHVSSMLTTIKSNNVTQRITFPVRAGIAASSISQMRDLVSNDTQSTLTIWSSENDPVNVTNLRSLIRQVGVNRIFIDVPKALENQLNLQSLGAGSTLTPIITIMLSTLLIFLIL